MAANVHSFTPHSRVFLGDEIKMIDLSPKEALELLSHVYINQRPIIQRHVRALLELHRSNLFRPTSLITIIRAKKSGEYIVVNGAHRLTMISQHDRPVLISIRSITVEDNHLLSEAEAEYRTHDVNGKTRSVKDILWSYETVRALGLEPHVADKIGAASNYIELGFPITTSGIDAKNRNADMRVPSMIKHVEAAKKLLGYIGSAKKTSKLYKAFMSKPVMAASIVICSTPNLEQAHREFFYTVCMDDAIPAGDPRKLLVNLIGNDWKKSDGKAYRDVEKAIIVKKAWVAWRFSEHPEYFRVDADSVLDAANFIAK